MVSNNILIVESVNDKYFAEAVKEHISGVDLDVDTPVCGIDDYECLSGFSKKKLESKLHELAIKIEKQGIERVGILLDADDEGIESKICLINEALKNINSTVLIMNPNEWYQCETLDVAISCHILNLDGKGELETLLRHVKSKDSVYADCLSAWEKCLEEKGKKISIKEFDKFWVSLYQRFDCCSRKEKKQAFRKCSFEVSMKKDIWDFSHPSLNQFRSFLQMFVQT